MKTTFELGRHRIQPGGRCFVIGEVALAHDGSLGTAHAFIDAIAAAGADAVKFQTHIASAESTKEEPFRIVFGAQDATRYDYWRRTEFTEHQWSGLARHAEEKALVFLSTPFSTRAVELLLRVGIHAWKIASGETQDVPLLERVMQTGLPILLSTGMSSTAEIDRLVRMLGDHEGGVLLFQSTSIYPCPPEKLGLDLIAQLRARYGCPVGLSDHSGTIFPGLATVLTGLDALEVHVTLSRDMFGPDVPASITPKELRLVVDGVRFLERSRDAGVAKDVLAGELAGQREIFGRSIVADRDFEAGTVLTEADLACKKPGGGLPPSALPSVIGRRTARPLRRDDRITELDLEPAATPSL